MVDIIVRNAMTEIVYFTIFITPKLRENMHMVQITLITFIIEITLNRDDTDIYTV